MLCPIKINGQSICISVTLCEIKLLKLSLWSSLPSRHWLRYLFSLHNDQNHLAACKSLCVSGSGSRAGSLLNLCPSICNTFCTWGGLDILTIQWCLRDVSHGEGKKWWRCDWRSLQALTYVSAHRGDGWWLGGLGNLNRARTCAVLCGGLWTAVVYTWCCLCLSRAPATGLRACTAAHVQTSALAASAAAGGR